MFTSLVDKYLRRGLHKGMHSLFMSIRNLYSDPVKVSQSVVPLSVPVCMYMSRGDVYTHVCTCS